MTEDAGENGTGGLLILYSNVFDNNGKIEANGKNGGSGAWTAGGGSGGGSINIFAKDIQNVGECTVNGGQGGSCSKYAVTAYTGGNGSISIGTISSGTYANTYKNY